MTFHRMSLMSLAATNLNPRQREVVEHEVGPLLVLAGAGSGKTRTIVHRIVRLINECRIHPNDILAVTFTNKAAGEMAERVAELLDFGGARPRWISTFHSACARILRREAPLLGLPRSFTIFDSDDQKKMIREVARDLNLGHAAADVGTYQHFIERARNRAWSPADAQEHGSSVNHEVLCRVFAEYHRRMRRNGTLDFGDLISAVIELLEKNPRVQAQYQQRWAHLMVDEFQDTNAAQYRLLRLLTSPPHDVLVVGDDDQCIYSWRGANVTNLLGFERDFPGTKTVRLEQNYRSTQAILDLANAIIVENQARKPKTLWTENEGGMKPVLFVGHDEREEAQFVARHLEQFRRSGDVNLGDCAIFYRTNAQSRINEEQLRRFDIPYRVIASTSFYERKEIKDVLAYLRLAVNPNDAIAAMRVVNVPRRGCGKTTIGRINAIAAAEDLSFLAAIERFLGRSEYRITKRARKGLELFVAVVEQLSLAADTEPPSGVTEWLLTEIDFTDSLRANHPQDYNDRYENVQELINAMRSFEDEAEADDELSPTLGGFLERTALVQPTDIEMAQDAVNLMTIHTAKGLEFPVVFLTGLEEGLIPLIRRGQDEGQTEEERRLCYVAATRAKQQLYLSYALNRRIYGSFKQRDRSRFIKTIPPVLFDIDAASARDLSVARSTQHRTGTSEMPAYEDVDQRPRWQTQTLEDVEIPPDGLRITRPSRRDDELAGLVGRTAVHRTFGQGTVTDAEYSGQRIKLTIRFPQVGVKKVIRRFVELT